MIVLVSESYINLLLFFGLDLWVVQCDGVYYYMNIEGDCIVLCKICDFVWLVEVLVIMVWMLLYDGFGLFVLWVLELYWVVGKWYFYYMVLVCGYDDDVYCCIYVLENVVVDLIIVSWVLKGVLVIDCFGIDGMVFEFGGKLYFVYLFYVGDYSDLVILWMVNLWMLIGLQVDIVYLMYVWEMQGGCKIFEGLEFLQGLIGKLFFIYLGSVCWLDDYVLGLFSVVVGVDLMDLRVWYKLFWLVFVKLVKNGVYVIGYNGFFQVLDGQDWIIYYVNSGFGMKCMVKWVLYIQLFCWCKDGMFDFGELVCEGVLLLVLC